MLRTMRFPVFAIVVAALLAGCGPAPAPKTEVTGAGDDRETVAQLAALNAKAAALVQSGKSDAAAALITRGEGLANRLLAASRPSLEAMQAISDHDDLYGRMLLANRNYGWARLEFQKNRVRWKVWQPQTEETERRRRQAEAAIAECDRHIAE